MASLQDSLKQAWLEKQKNNNNNEGGKESFWKEEKTLLEIPESEFSYSEIKLVIDKQEKLLIGIQSRYINRKTGEVNYGKGMYKPVSFWQDFLKLNLQELIKNSENKNIKPAIKEVKENIKQVKKEIEKSKPASCCVTCKKPADKLSKKGLCKVCYYKERNKS